MKRYPVRFSDEPVGPYRHGRRYHFPFDKLGVGKCFIIVGMNKNILAPWRRYAEVKLKRKFKTEKREDGVYVWRVE